MHKSGNATPSSAQRLGGARNHVWAYTYPLLCPKTPDFEELTGLSALVYIQIQICLLRKWVQEYHEDWREDQGSPRTEVRKVSPRSIGSNWRNFHSN